jgi:hypothetical protein
MSTTNANGEGSRKRGGDKLEDGLTSKKLKNSIDAGPV